MNLDIVKLHIGRIALRRDGDGSVWRPKGIRAIDTHIDVKTVDQNLGARIHLDGTGRDNNKIALWKSEAPTPYSEAS